MRMLSILVLVLALLLSACSTTLRHPQTGATVTCQSGGWVGIGIIGLAIMAVGNIWESVAYHQCVNKAETAGYAQDVTPIQPEVIPAAGAADPTGAQAEPQPNQ